MEPIRGRKTPIDYEKLSQEEKLIHDSATNPQNQQPHGWDRMPERYDLPVREPKDAKEIMSLDFEIRKTLELGPKEIEKKLLKQQ